jgi:signal transduction histidine kinase
VDALDETIREIRSSIFALQTRPEAARPGLRSRILDVADEMTQMLGLAPTLQLDGQLDDAVPDEIADQMLSALREALSNVARHSGASQVDVSVRAGSDLILTVRDNGTGIAELARRSGLHNLDERARKLNGSLRVGNATGGGTELVWQAPLATAADPGAR